LYIVAGPVGFSSELFESVTYSTLASELNASVVYDAPGTFLANKRVFAFAPAGIPDGIKVDAAGNVWSGTGSGVAVWSEAGDLIGQITVQGGAANFGFGETEQTVFVLGENLLWRVRLDI
jgi:gluconolactonase